MKHLVMFLLIGTQLGAWADTFNVISMTNLWKYRQDGVAPGASWREAGYDDSGWSNGRALLYVETSPLPAPKNTPLSLTNASGQRVVTYYFRTTFTLSNITDVTLIFSNVVDDGAVFHLNGVEVLRLGMPHGVVNNSTLAYRTISEAAYEGGFFIPPTNLVVGTNVVAVEVHQIHTNSTDIVFGASIEATTDSLGVVAVTPSVATAGVGQATSLTASDTGPQPVSFRWRFAKTLPDLDEVFAGVRLLTSGPGSALGTFVMSPDWIPIGSVTSEIKVFDTFAAVRSYGQGKAAVFGHTGFFSPGFDNTRLWGNLADWCDPAGLRTIGFSSGHGEANTFLMLQSMASSGYVARVISAPITPAKLTNLAVLVVNGSGFETEFTTNEIEVVRQFVAAGGAIWASGAGWVWYNYHAASSLTNWPMTKLMAPYGVEWDLAYVDNPTWDTLYPTLYTPLPGQTNAVLDLFNVNTNDAGRYTVVARNPYGERQASALLTVLRPAAITVGPVSLSAANWM